MKYLIFIITAGIFLTVNIIFSNQEEKIPLYLISKCDEEDCECLLERMAILQLKAYPIAINPSIGKTYYYDIDTNKYKKRKLFFLFEDLRNKFKFLESMIYNNINHRYSKTERNSFFYFFQYNDSTMLVVDGCIENCRSFDTKDDVWAEKMIESQKNYALYMYLIDVKKYYQYQYKIKNDASNNIVSNDLITSLIEKFFADKIKGLIKKE